MANNYSSYHYFSVVNIFGRSLAKFDTVEKAREFCDAEIQRAQGVSTSLNIIENYTNRKHLPSGDDDS